MPQNDFLVWAPSGGSVMSQAAYAQSPSLNNGVVSGTADPTLFNKTQRQSSIMAAMLAQFIVQQTGQSVIDDGSTSTILANFIASLQGIAGTRYIFDESTPPASLIAMKPGDTLTITHQPATFVPLYVASSPGIYRLVWTVTATTTTNADVILFANGTSFTGAFSSWAIEADDSGTGAPPFLASNAVNAFNFGTPYFFFDLFSGPNSLTDSTNDIGPFIIEMTLSTYTTAKTVRYTGGVAGGGAAGFSKWNDTTTPWSQLGTLSLGNGLVGGTVFIERVV